MNTGSRPLVSDHGLITTIAASTNDCVKYALEGSVSQAGLSYSG
jgi:Glycerol kinase